MRSRWARFFCSRASNAKASRARLIAAALTLGCFLVPVKARATLSIRSLQSTSTNDKFYFAGTAAGGNVNNFPGAAFPAFPDPDPSYRFRILNYSTAASCGAGTCDLSAGIEFVVTSNKTTFANPAGSPMSVIVVHVFQSSGATNQTFAPIAAVNGQRCNGSICATLGQDTGGRAFFLGAIFNPGEELTITLMPRDICSFAVSPSGSTGAATAFTPSICDNGGGVLATTPMQLFVKFSVIAVPDNATSPAGATPITAAASLDDGPSSTTLNFQSESPGKQGTDDQCVLSGDIEGVYFPGDGGIHLETGRFGVSLTSGGDAPGDAMIVVGTKSATPPNIVLATLSTQSALNSALNGSTYSLVQRVPFNSGTQRVSGFNNSESAGDGNSYSLGFLVRDKAGLVAAPQTAGTCQLTGVRTAAIQGFLKEGKCFIATAAFRDYKHGPVAMLRQFRDGVLLRHGPGRAFVRWYYDWSPGAAEWLMEHPAFRYPVLLALLPLEVMAWLGLHPPVLASLLLFASLVLASAAYRRAAVPTRRE